jgi:hypothetical protein
VYRHLADAKAPYDAIFCLGLFYHIDQPVRLMSLMSRACRDYVILDTVVHRSNEAVVSVRPVKRKKTGDDAYALEFVSSPKAIYWMAENAGFTEVRTLSADTRALSSLGDYRSGHRRAFVLSKGAPIEPIWPNSKRWDFPSISSDFERYGYYPEIHGGREGRQPVGLLAKAYRALKRSVR